MPKWGKAPRNAEFMFWEGPRECDMCDETGYCASISDLIGNVSIICNKCLHRMLMELEEAE